MKLMKTCLFFFFCLFVTSLTFGQIGLIELYYDPSGGDPLGCPCETTTDNPYQDGTIICLRWDNDVNGPSLLDSIPRVGTGYTEVNWNCMSLNGATVGFGAGYFYPESYLVINLPQEANGDHPVYYLQINSGGCCWNTDTFTVSPGEQSHPFVWANWHCANTPCPSDDPIPTPPTNFDVLRDSRCLSIQAAWQHDGLNVNGFNIYEVNQQGGQDILRASPGMNDRTTTFSLLSDQPHEYYIKAAGVSGESDSSNHDTGSTYMLRFVSGAAGNITGQQLANTQFTVQVERPTSDCFSHWELWLLSNGNRRNVLCMDSIISATSPITIQCRFPNDTTIINCRLLLVDTSVVQEGIMFTDTTDSIFHLGRPSAVDVPVSLMPDRFGLAQNYPNPFNPETEIVFNVPVNSAVRIQVYNIMGQLVRTLTDSRYTAGMHHIRWDGRSDAGVAVGAGIYLYRMDSPGFTQTKKMLLMK
ncbi:T9SS C-terminal target domain-containing protein [candidate division KSB1 bacterium]|nr:MAG: T9SS C-terminal target domain-containing protein [candidate division KSB1 bacterium]